MNFHGSVPDNADTDKTKKYTVSAVLTAETDPATVKKNNISFAWWVDIRRTIRVLLQFCK